MVRTEKIALYRQKLDQTLASHDLIDQKKLEALVKDQILRSSDDKSRGCIDNVIKKRTAEVSNFLEMLRSASENYHASRDRTQYASWKLKQDSEDFRVMYKEGPAGSPFHSLLVEGYIDAPLDVCLCVSWEVALYQRWFPEIFIPTFKVVVAKSLQKVRIGEEIALMRMKLSWPLSGREAILHYFEFEYLEDDLVVVLINTIPDVANIQMETHGFTSEGMPEAGNTVRVDLVGGFALQKVSDNRSYFRTIGNMDIKLDFVPPSLINFISRQLIGTGFRFYQKIVASIAKGDEDFGKALNDPLYKRIREAVLSNSTSRRHLETQTGDEEKTLAAQDVSRKDDVKFLANGHVSGSSHVDKPISNEIEEEYIEKTPYIQKHVSRKDDVVGDMLKVEDHKVLENGNVNGYSIKYKPAIEIEEEETDGMKNTIESGEVNNVGDTTNGINSTDQLQLEKLLKKVQISPEVEKALGTLDKVISVVREGKLKDQGWTQASSPEISWGEVKGSTIEKHVKWDDELGVSTEEIIKDTARVPKNGNSVDGLRSADTDFQPQVANPGYSPSAGSSAAMVSPMNAEVDGIHENNPIESKKTLQPKKWRLGCLHLISGRFMIFRKKGK